MIEQKDPDVSLIIVTYNAEEFIADCLLSVKEQSYSSLEILIVDNNSQDKTTEIIETYFPFVKLIKSHINLGFTGGVQLGFENSKGKYIALLNPDTRAEKKWLENLVSAMDIDAYCGICASLMLKWGTQLVDTAGDGCTRAGKGYKLGHNELASNHQETREIFAACGGAALYRRKMLDEIGFFDPDFFLLHEDTDLSFRAQLAGWKCSYISAAVVEHRVSASIGYKTSLAVYHSVKNSDIVWLKNMPGLLLCGTIFEKIASDIASLIYLGIIHRKMIDVLKAKIYVVKNIFKILDKRRKIQRGKKVSNKQIYQLLTPFLSVNYLKKIWKEKNNELKNFSQSGGGSNKASDIGNNTNS
ncbi:glycosyltransferase family 2 protein [Desulforamulus aeronauticus]|uniref:Glycosyltransferase 2-like domain-containing protein n=1 Tax=Desulforamulus aeronauticus DSM 10349 TaxID=1121421 RepID=A0A1M6T4D3_9FIRM|nr:glycosyltransferase family 2 protein [Desulforamulus aeronauticus]SHK51770.1 hypothetical protein SAMN02745123_02165 [Desulforamulus aeronauticus DSM 10349]